MQNTRGSAPARRKLTSATRLAAALGVTGLLVLGATACSSAASATPGVAAGDAAAGGDIPDNAVFLTYADTTLGFSIQYVEGWQVSPDGSGVVIRDKDSSETVAVVTTAADAATYVAQTDLPALQQQAGFALVSQDTVTVGAATYPHLVYTMPSPPDPVTDKRVPSTIDRYYVQANGSMAVVSLSTPDGVDNVDAFRQMIESFTWS